MSLNELLRQIEESPLSKQLVRRVQAVLPADDTELNQWLADALQRLAHAEFVCLISAAIASARQVDPRHLAKGGIVLAAAEILPEIVMRMPEGEVPEYLLQAAEVNIPRRHKALMLAVIAVWCRVHRGSQFPKKLTELAREMAREGDDNQSIPNWLVAVAVITGDQSLAGILRRTCPAFSRDSEWTKLMVAERGFENMIMAIPKQSILDRFGDGGGQGRLIALGTNMRRAVARVGRNDPCPCGSGKKYKKCCFEKDQERLRHSTNIEGVTAEELDEAPEAHLTADSFWQLPWERLDRIDPQRLPEPLLKPYFERMLATENDDRTVDKFEKAGYPETLRDVWRSLALHSAANQRPDLVERLVTLRRNAGFQDHDLDDMIRFCLFEENPAEWLAFLEDQMTEALYYEDPNLLMHLAQALAYSHYPALGVFVCRSVAPLVPSANAATVLEELLKARDRLGYLAEDPISDVLDKLAARRGAEAEQSEAEREALLALDATRRASRELNGRIKQTERELARRTAELEENARKNSTKPEDDPVVRELQRKLDGMKSEVKVVHNERNAYRRKFEEAQEEIDSLKQSSIPEKTASEPPDSAANDEGDLLLPEEAFGTQPVRLIDFPRNFEPRLREIPKQIARSTMVVLGRLASGDAKAFEGAVRLKAVPTVTRLRIGIDWRLLFRLLPERIEVVDLIPRQDLERRIKTLTG